MANRRGRGEGTISQRADGRWEARVDLGWRNGKRQRKIYYGATRGEVRDKLTRALRDRQRGAALADERQTLGAFLDAWLKTIVTSVRPKTHASYSQLVRSHLRPALGHVRLARLEAKDVEKMLADKQTAGLSPRTCQYLRAVLRRALGRAMKNDLVSRNVAAMADPPRMVKREVKSLTPDEARTFLTSIAEHKLYPVIAIAVSVGMRQGEILGLRWDDVDLDRGSLRVQHQLERIGKTWRLAEPKSETSKRLIKLPGSLVPILRAHRTKQLETRLAAGGKWKEHGFVFTARHGQPLEGTNLNEDTKALMKEAGVPVLHFHALRHSCATFLLVQGVSARVVMDVLGHSDVRLTLNTYSHAIEQLQDAAASAMETALWQK